MLRVYTRFNLLNNFPQFLLYSTSSSSNSSSSSSSSKSSSTNEISEYLVNSLRFSQQQAVTTSTKLSTCKNVDFSNLSQNAVSVVDEQILSAINVLKKILVFDEHCLLSNVTFLTSYGVPIESITKHLFMQHSTFLRKPDEFKDIVVKVEKKLQNPPDSAMFLYGVQLFMYTSEENIESKCRVFKSFGWTQSDVNTLMSKIPKCFTLSDENIKKKLEFLMNDLGLEPAFLASRGCLLAYSLEKRALPRHKVLEVLKEKELLKKCPRLSSVVTMTESRFVKMFVLLFEEVHQVYADHIGCSVESLTQK